MPHPGLEPRRRVAPTSLTVLLVATMLAAALPAYAYVERQLISGGDAKAGLKLSAKSGKVRFSGAHGLLTMRDPRCPAQGANSTIELKAAGQGTGLVTLPCQNWSFTGKGYRYDDPIGLHAGITKIIWKSRKLTVKLKGNHYVPIAGPIAALSARLTIGNETYCGQFTTFGKNGPTSIASAASGACAPLPTPTPTLPIIIINFPTATPTPSPVPELYFFGPSDGTFIDPAGPVSVEAFGQVLKTPPGAQVYVATLQDLEACAGVTPCGVLVWQQGVSDSINFSTTVPLDPTRLFNPILAELYTNPANGTPLLMARARTVAIYSDSIPEGQVDDQGFAMRMQDSGLLKLKPVMEDTIDVNGINATLGDQVGPGDLLATVEGHQVTALTAPSISDVTLDSIASENGYIDLQITLEDLNLDLHLDIIGGGCDYELNASWVEISGHYDLSPDGANPAQVAVTELSNSVLVAGLTLTLFDGHASICPNPLNASQLQSVSDALEDKVDEIISENPPGPAGPIVADKIEESFADFDLVTGPGDGLCVDIDAPMNSIVEFTSGVTVNADADIVKLASPPGGVDACTNPPASPPNFFASVQIPSTFPSFAINSPCGQPYHLAVGFSFSAMNQLLKAQAEYGQFNKIITEVDVLTDVYFPGLGTIPILLPTKITAGLLVDEFGLVEFGSLPPATPLRVRVYPGIAPVVTAEPPPSFLDEATLEVAEFRLYLESCHGPNAPDSCNAGDTFKTQLAGVADFKTGLNMSVHPVFGDLSVALSEPVAGSVRTYLLINNIGVNDTLFNTVVLPELIEKMVPEMAAGLEGLPLPEFEGLTALGQCVWSAGGFINLYMNLCSADCP